MTIYVILVIRSDLFYSIGASGANKIITPSDRTREEDHLDHDPYYQVIVNRMSTNIMLKFIYSLFYIQPVNIKVSF